MEDLQKIRLEVKNRLAHITLNDPPDNFLSIQMLGELADTLEWLAGQTDLVAVMFSASGGCFTAGLDYREHNRELVFTVAGTLPFHLQHLAGAGIPFHRRGGREGPELGL